MDDHGPGNQGDELWRRCVDFHGHECPGLALGYKASRFAMEKLREDRAADEELVAFVENDACFVDAVQVITGCTFGKGNFFYLDYGKIALRLLSRRSGHGVRVSLKKQVHSQDSEHRALMKKIMTGEADGADRARFQELNEKRTREILGKDPRELFHAEKLEGSVPERARIEPSKLCESCGELTMPSKMVVVAEKAMCRPCAEKGSA
ncbi:FmdE family protein [Desulfosoma caldarium]|uniref:Formylmethanofuran dehydrogenase subunit E n=1 Tax=Desulfosoma caldarium TaxID=610254 RepID=A0A3N1V0X4_9BACT|nr:FmdE family protein [Desulfosoma caldarium]ROQ93196.1 formylmethanofuran dehydrogenase subunit E [Desulfosoma caldarium]